MALGKSFDFSDCHTCEMSTVMITSSILWFGFVLFWFVENQMREYMIVIF